MTLPKPKFIEEIEQARLYLGRQKILVGDGVLMDGYSEAVTYLGLISTEHGAEAVVRLLGDLLWTVHYSRLTKVEGGESSND